MVNAAVLAAFSQPVSYQPEAGDAFTITGILEKQTDEQRQVDGVYARLFVNLPDFAVPPVRGDQVTIGGASYIVFQVLMDTAGGCWLALREKS